MQKWNFVNESPRYSAVIALFPARFQAAAVALLSRGLEMI
jgi:hypothetical protein